MSVTKDNIIIAGTSMSLSVGGNDVGATKGGVEMEVTSDYYDVIVDQQLTPVKRKLIGRSCRVRTTLEEATLENLRIAWNLASSALVSSSLTLDNSENGEVELVFVGVGPNDTTRTATFFSAVAMTTGPVPNAKDAESGIPVEFECLYNDSEGSFGTMVDA